MEYLIFIEPAKCAPRWSMQDCSTLNDRKRCLTSIESRRQNETGGDIYGSECAWCDSRHCKERSSSMCQPESMLQGIGEVEYETCLDVKGDGKNRLINDVQLCVSDYFIISKQFDTIYSSFHFVS